MSEEEAAVGLGIQERTILIGPELEVAVYIASAKSEIECLPVHIVGNGREHL
jgi:hypothetical protein